MKNFVPSNLLVLTCLLFAISVAGCGSNASPNNLVNNVANTVAVAAPPIAPPLQFTDVTRPSGLQFRHNNGAFGAALFPETMGSGAAWFDFDNDGDADVFLVNGRNWTPQEVLEYDKSPVSQQEMQLIIAKAKREGQKTVLRSPPNKTYQRTTGKLYRNDGDGTFSDITKNSGLDVEMLGMGAAAGDYDGDGKIDLCVTSYGRIYLFRNLGKGRFREEAQSAVCAMMIGAPARRGSITTAMANWICSLVAI